MVLLKALYVEANVSEDPGASTLKTDLVDET
jgi:hypothetical protein